MIMLQSVGLNWELFFSSQGAFGNVQRYLWLSVGVGRAVVLLAVEAMEAAKPSKLHRIAPTTRSYLIQNVTDANVEKPCFTLCLLLKLNQSQSTRC